MRGIVVPFLSLILFVSPFTASGQQMLPRIINGQPVPGRNSPVVAILEKNPRGRFIRQVGLCSGSILSKNAVLTASHCVSNSSKNLKVIIGGRQFAVKKVKVDPSAVISPTGLIQNDAAILFLKKPTSKTPLALLVSRPPTAGDTVSIFGYGLDQFGNAGILREATTVISDVFSDFWVSVFDAVGEGNSCNGDSGGPAVFSYTDPSGRQRSGIIGIVAAGTSETCGPGDTSLYVNIQATAVLNFIMRQVRRVNLQ